MDYRVLGKLGDQLMRNMDFRATQGKIVYEKNLYAIQAICELTGIKFKLTAGGCTFFLDGKPIQKVPKPISKQDIDLLLADMLSKKYVHNILIDPTYIRGTVHNGDIKPMSYKDYRILKQGTTFSVIDGNQEYINSSELDNLINSKKVMEDIKTLFTNLDCLAVTLNTVQLANSRYKIVYGAAIS